MHSNKKYSKRLSQKKKYVGIEDFQDFTIPYEILKTAVLAPNVLEFMEKFEFVHEQMVDNNYKFDGFQANNDFMDNFELEDQNNHQFDLINNINEEKPVDLFMNPSNSKEKLDLSLIQKKNDLIGKGEGIPVLENQY